MEIADEPISVNDAIARLTLLAGREVRVKGVLSCNFEEASLDHWPKAERGEGYRSSIWITLPSDGTRINGEICRRMNGRRVVVRGTLCPPIQALDGCGHMGLWPAEILALALETA